MAPEDVTQPRTKVAFAANARCGVGGQGANLRDMSAALSRHFDLLQIAAVPCEQLGRTVAISPPATARILARVPYTRRSRSVIVSLSERHFRRRASRFDLSSIDLLIGVAGQCRDIAERVHRRVPVIVDSLTVHADALHEVMAGSSREMGTRPPMDRRMREGMIAEYRLARKIRIQSDLAARTFVDRGVPASALFVAPPAIDADLFPKATFQSPSFEIVYAGGLEPWKGIGGLLTAYRRAALGDARLRLCGGITSRAMGRYLDQHAEATVSVQPFDHTPSDLDRVFGRASVLVHPSLTDGFAYSVLEAMASGLPVIVSDATGAAELVEEGRSGFVVPAGDVDALVDRLRHLHDRPHLLPIMGAHALATARQYTIERLAASLASEIRSCLD